MSRILGAIGCNRVSYSSSANRPPRRTTYVRVVYYAAPAPLIQPAPVIQRVAYVQPAAVVYRPVLRPFTTFAAPAPQAVYYSPQPVVVAPPQQSQSSRSSQRRLSQGAIGLFWGGTVTRVWYP